MLAALEFLDHELPAAQAHTLDLEHPSDMTSDVANGTPPQSATAARHWDAAAIEDVGQDAVSAARHFDKVELAKQLDQLVIGDFPATAANCGPISPTSACGCDWCRLRLLLRHLLRPGLGLLRWPFLFQSLRMVKEIEGQLHPQSQPPH